MRYRTIVVAVLASVVAACLSGPGSETMPPVDEPTNTDGPTLIRDGDNFYVTNLPRNMSALAHQGTLFAALRPIARTGDPERVAVLSVVQAPPPNSGTVKVAVQCQRLQDRGRPLVELAVEPLAPTGHPSVGQCVAKIVDASSTDDEDPHVVLDVGSHHGLQAGDVFWVLGRPVVADGPVPLGLDTRLDGECQIVNGPDHRPGITARCDLLRMPQVDGSLEHRYAVFKNRGQ
ncbi:MAG: hypothetical protein K0V04_13370 [Deltaproteobacteria bacterium]|nr:hypothetical protein [Deltaproteobacteria bacterium]